MPYNRLSTGLQHLCVLIVFITGVSNCAKILFISPNLSNSMILYTGRMADVLVRAGHNVTFFIPEINSRNRLNGTKLAKVVRMKGLGKSFEEHMNVQGDLFDLPSPTIWTRRAEMSALIQTCEEILKRRDELEWLKSENFDLAFADNLDLCDIGLIRLLEIKLHAWTTTGAIHDITALTVGIPPEASYTPVIWDNFFGPVMPLWQRVINLFRLYTDRILTYELNYKITRLFRTYVRLDFPEAWTLAGESSLLFVNGDEFLNPSRPVPSKVVNIGGVGQTKAQPLNQKFAHMISKGEKGYVLFSLGTAAPTIAVSAYKKRLLVEAFAHFTDYHFIVKADNDDIDFRNLTYQTSNVEIVSWFPQNSLLANAQLFITHGGYNGILESGAINGCPMLVLPLFFDQHYNAKIVEYREIGRALEPQKLSVDLLKTEIATLLRDPKYKLNAQRIQTLFRTKPNQPDETLVKWTNFLLTNGVLKELRPELLSQTWITYNHLDIIALTLFTTAILLFTTQYAFQLFKKPTTKTT
ncbi:UDP-glucuronosyltransferase [Aphelenchoides besseyi]|nr:UDP-glucuronosyltransferase [Aphelenchoides besseyi]